MVVVGFGEVHSIVLLVGPTHQPDMLRMLQSTVHFQLSAVYSKDKPICEIQPIIVKLRVSILGWLVAPGYFGAEVDNSVMLVPSSVYFV